MSERPSALMSFRELLRELNQTNWKEIQSKCITIVENERRFNDTYYAKSFSWDRNYYDLQSTIETAIIFLQKRRRVRKYVVRTPRSN